MRSLRSRLWLLWALACAASFGVGWLLLDLSRSTTVAEAARAEAVVARSCDLIGDRYAFYVAGWGGGALDTTTRRGLRAVVVAALATEPGLAGGIWSTGAGSVAQAFPAEAGRLPTTENAIRAVSEANRAAELSDGSVSRRVPLPERAVLVIAACPLPGPLAGLTAWTAARVRARPVVDQQRLGVALLLGLLVAIAAVVASLTLVWGRHLRGIEVALARHDIEALPVLEHTGERELDRVVVALNEAGARLAAARARTEALAERTASVERLAALGRVAAGMAHELRNPMAAMRLRLENALEGDPSRFRPAVRSSLEQLGRIDALITELLAMSQRREPDRRPVQIDALLRGRVAAHRDAAARAGVALALEPDPEAGDEPANAHPGDTPAEVSALVVPLDAEMISRALDNVVLNAIRHTPGGGAIRLRAERGHGEIRIACTDTGPGVDDAIRARLFEPFSTGRPDGTGLGLAIARELVEAHGGRLFLAAPTGDGGASFVMVLPTEVT